MKPSPRVMTFSTGILERAEYPFSCTKVTMNCDLNSGSSKQGKAARASVASNWVVAMYLEKMNEQVIVEVVVNKAIYKKKKLLLHRSS